MSNEQFQTVLQDAKKICRFKISSFQESLGEADAALQALIEETKEVFRFFSRPMLFLTEIEFDEIAIRVSLLKISETPTDDYPAFENRLKALLQKLRELKPDNSSIAPEEERISIINERIADALALTKRRITDRMKKFAKDDRIELHRDAEFIALRKRQVPLGESYREALKKKDIIGTEGDKLHIDNLGLLIKATKKKEGFFKVYDKLSDFMEEEMKKIKDPLTT